MNHEQALELIKKLYTGYQMDEEEKASFVLHMNICSQCQALYGEFLLSKNQISTSAKDP